MALHSIIYPRDVTEFIYRYTSPNAANIFVSFRLNSKDRKAELTDVMNELEKQGFRGTDISDNELAKTHMRYMIGGKLAVPHERIFRFGAGCLEL